MSNDDVLDFVYENYPEEKFNKQELTEFLNTYKNNIEIVRNNGKLEAVAFYLRLTDKSIEKVRQDSSILESVENGLALLKENGKNIHFIQVLSKRREAVLNGLKEVIRKEQPETVSWYKENLKNFREIKFRS